MLQIFNSLSVYSWKIIHYDMFPWDEFVIHMSTIGEGKFFALRGELVWALNYHCCMLLMLLVLLIVTGGVDTFSTQRWRGYSHTKCLEMVELFFALRSGLGAKLSFLHVAHTPHAA